MTKPNSVFVDVKSQTIYMPGAKAIAKLPASNFPKDKPTAPIHESDEYSSKIAAWGVDNQFPQKVLKECETDTIVPTTLRFMARALYGAGLSVGKVIDYKEDGSEIFKPEKYPPWEVFKKRSNIKLLPELVKRVTINKEHKLLCECWKCTKSNSIWLR